jgi:hypothetical protein
MSQNKSSLLKTYLIEIFCYIDGKLTNTFDVILKPKNIPKIPSPLTRYS